VFPCDCDIIVTVVIILNSLESAFEGVFKRGVHKREFKSIMTVTKISLSHGDMRLSFGIFRNFLIISCFFQ
jgi:hypothetical protein